MQRIYEAANNVEAHMVVHLLSQSGVEAHIHGEHLQSGAGELPLGSLVAVAVQDEDAAEARKIIREWEARTAPDRDPALASAASGPFHTSAIALVVGALLSGAFVWSLHHGPETSKGADWNDDGRLDERAYYDGARLDRVELDRNFDGRVDAIERYANSGPMESLQADDDFDGRMERTTEYRGREPVVTRIDADGDGEADYQINFKFGVIDTYEYLNESGAVVKRVQYRGFKMQRAQLDLDADGVWERTYRFDRYDQPIDR